MGHVLGGARVRDLMTSGRQRVLAVLLDLSADTLSGECLMDITAEQMIM